jgi:hypothetical protein
MSANPKLHMTNVFDVLDRIPGKKRGTGGVYVFQCHMIK